MAVCRACGEVIEFRRTGRGKWRPYNLDGTVHFATCTAGWVYDVGRFRRKFGHKPQPATGGTGRLGDQAG